MPSSGLGCALRLRRRNSGSVTKTAMSNVNLATIAPYLTGLIDRYGPDIDSIEYDICILGIVLKVNGETVIDTTGDDDNGITLTVTNNKN